MENKNKNEFNGKYEEEKQSGLDMSKNNYHDSCIYFK